MFAKATAQNLVYRLFDIPPDDFRREALRLFTGGVRGLNVTLPHKQAAAELVNELTPRAERAQAVNTIAFFDDTSLLGDNTDGLGLTVDLERNLGHRASRTSACLILGAGGAVRGVLGPLLERELRELIIANRTPERARKLAAEFADMGEISGCGFAELAGPPYDLIINATSAGLQGEMPEMPGGLGRAKRPFATTWPTAAATRPSRCGRNPCTPRRTSKGWGMLVEQAAESFLLWRGIRPDTAAGAAGARAARLAARLGSAAARPR